MFKVPHEFGARCRLLGGSLNAPGKYLGVENTTLNFIQEKLSSSSLSPSSSPPSCFLADIPLEILLEILDHLPDSWVISLALTCKGFYSTIAQFYQKKLALTSRDVAKFTMTLQKDIPNVYCCIRCYKLCRLNRSVSWIHQGHQNCSGPFWWDSWNWSPARRRFSKSDVQSLLWHPGTSEAMIYFMDAYLVMNRHFYGNRHGLPLRILERHAAFEKYILINDDMDMDLDWLDWDDSRERDEGRKRLKTFRQGVFDQRPERSATGNFEKPWRFSFDYLPKIIDDELFMARFHRVDGPMVPWKQFATLLNSSMYFCRVTLVNAVLLLKAA